MNIQTRNATPSLLPSLTSRPTLKAEALDPEAKDWLEIGAGAARGALHAVVWAGPGAVAGYRASKGRSAEETLRWAMGCQGLAVGAAAGFAFGGGIGAAVGAAVGGVTGVIANDFLWSEKASKAVDQALKPVLDGDSSGDRARVARSVRATRLGLQATSKEAFKIGDEVGQGKVAGLQRGLARVPNALTRDSSKGLPELPSRSVAKKIVGLPLGLLAGGVSALAGVTGSLGTDPSIGSGLFANTILAGAVALGLASVPALAGLSLPLLGVAAGGAVVGGMAYFNGMGVRYLDRQYNDRAQMPNYESFADPSSANVANRRQARIENLAAGLKNGAIEGFEAGSRLTDPVLDGAAHLGQRVVATLRNLPEKLGGIADGFRDK